MNITVQFGGRTFSREFTEGTKVSQVINDDVVKAALGLTGPVRTLLDGYELSTEVVLAGGETLVLETAAQKKG